MSLVLLLLIISCSAKTVNLKVENVDIHKILDSIKKSNSEINSLEGLAKVKAVSSFDNVSYNQATILEYPDLFRLEALAVFGQTIAVIISDGEKVYFKTPRESITFDDSQKFNLSYFYSDIPTELKTTQLIEILLGKIPFGLWDENKIIGISEERELFVNYKNDNETYTSIYFNPINGEINTMIIELSNGENLRINYSDYNRIGDNNFPKTIEILYAKGQLIIKYGKDILLNSEVDSNLFLP